LQNRKSTLTAKEREIINLVVSQVNDCKHCLEAHTTIEKMQGFFEDQILEIRRTQISFNDKYAALATFVRETYPAIYSGSKLSKRNKKILKFI